MRIEAYQCGYKQYPTLRDNIFLYFINKIAELLLVAQHLPNFQYF